MITFAPYCYKQLLSSVIMYKTSTRTLIAVQVNFFIQLPTFTCCFHCRITTNHFFHSLLETQYQKTSISASEGYRHRSQIIITIISGAPWVKNLVISASKKFWFWENRPYGVRASLILPPSCMPGFSFAFHAPARFGGKSHSFKHF